MEKSTKTNGMLCFVNGSCLLYKAAEMINLFHLYLASVLNTKSKLICRVNCTKMIY